MQELRSQAQEAAEDIFFGQVVLIWARWFVILAGSILVLWSAPNTSELANYLVPIVAIMAINFFLHGRYLMELPASRPLLLAMSVLDLLVIGAMVAFHAQVGLKSGYFVFYYPVIFAFSLVFPPRVTIGYSVMALVAYSAVCSLADPSLLGSSADLKTLAVRLITLASTAALGTYYWRIQRDRRRAASGGATTRAGLSAAPHGE